MLGVPWGMTMVAGIFSLRAEYATPWAWLPVQVSSLSIFDHCGCHTGRACDNTLPASLRVQMCHFIICTSQLKAKDWLQVFPLEQNLAF